LEETLTPHLKEMLAQKLQEMEEDEMEETVNGADAKTYAEDPRAHGNVELNEEEEEEAPEEEGEEQGEEEEELSVEDMSVEDLKDLIRDIVAQETGNDEEAEMETGEEAPEGDDMTSMDGDSEEIDINELLAELEGMNEDDGYGKTKTIPGKPTHSYSLKPGAESGDRKGPNDGYVKEDVLDESLMRSVVDMLGVSNDTAQMLIAAVGGLGVVGASAITSKLHDMALKGTFGAKAQASAKSASQFGAAAGAATQQRSVKPVESGDEMEEGLGDAIKGAAQKIGGAVKKGNEKFA